MLRVLSSFEWIPEFTKKKTKGGWGNKGSDFVVPGK
jgi:hypothetical protein